MRGAMKTVVISMVLISTCAICAFLLLLPAMHMTQHYGQLVGVMFYFATSLSFLFITLYTIYKIRPLATYSAIEADQRVRTYE